MSAIIYLAHVALSATIPHMSETASWAYVVYPLASWAFAIFMFLFTDNLISSDFRSQRKLLFAAGAVCLAAAAVWSAPSFVGELLHRALDVTVRSTFSTSYAAIVRDIAIAVYVLIRVLRRGGYSEVRKHLENVKDGAVAVVAAFILTILYHLIITVPQEIKTGVAIPKISFPAPRIPDGALAKTVHPATRTRATSEVTLRASVNTPPNKDLPDTSVTITNDDSVELGDHKIWCDVKKVSFANTRIINQGNSFTVAVPWNHTPIGPHGDAQTDKCVYVATTGSPVLCVDLIVSFDYFIKGDNAQKTRQFRFVGRGGSIIGPFEWGQQPLNFSGSYCGGS